MQRLSGKGNRQKHDIADTRDDLRPIKTGKSPASRALWLIVSALLFAAVALSTLTFFHGSKPKPEPKPSPPKPSPSPPSKLPTHLPTARPTPSTSPTPKHAAPEPASPPYKPRHASDFVTVAHGDSLWILAQEHYGDGNDWTKIYNANRDKIQNPDLIYAGEVLAEP